MHPEPQPPSDAAALVRRLLDPACPPFALLRRRSPGRDGHTVEVLIGEVTEVERLADIPLGSEVPDAPVTDALALIPFRQIRERGFRAHDDGTPLAVLRPTACHELPLEELLAALPTHDVRVRNGAFDVTDAEYAEVVDRVVREEIGAGEGANFVIRRTFEGEIADFSAADALALFRRLLAGERGAYWTFVVHRPGVRTLVGASPEVHVRMTGGTVVMNPISGTYRYPVEGPTAAGLLAFLDDRKEVEELSMVVDEELKMMCTVGDQGGVVVGPRLKEMAHLAHTEYELRGRSTLDVREVLKETMFAATVTGSPVQNACRVIERHEPVGPDGRGRGYYAGALALIGRAPGPGREAGAAAQTLDSPILIRTADIAADGRLRCRSAPPWCAPPTRTARSPRRTPRPPGCSPRWGCDRRPRGPRPGPRRGWPTTRGCGPRWTPAAPTWPRSGCGCRPPRRSPDCTATPWSSTPRTPSPRCWRTCCAPRG